MKVHVKFEFSGRKVDETLTGANADAILAEAKTRVAKELGWKGMFLNPLPPLQFAQLAVKKYNEARGTDHPLPSSAAEFFAFGQQIGTVQILEP